MNHCRSLRHGVQTAEGSLGFQKQENFGEIWEKWMIQAEEMRGKHFVREPGFPSTSVCAAPVKSRTLFTHNPSPNVLREKNLDSNMIFFSVSLEVELS